MRTKLIKFSLVTPGKICTRNLYGGRYSWSVSCCDGCSLCCVHVLFAAARVVCTCNIAIAYTGRPQLVLCAHVLLCNIGANSENPKPSGEVKPTAVSTFFYFLPEVSSLIEFSGKAKGSLLREMNYSSQHPTKGYAPHDSSSTTERQSAQSSTVVSTYLLT